MKEDLTYSAFCRRLQEIISEKLKGGIIVKQRRIQRNNGVEADVLLFSSKSGNLSPSFYLSAYYEKYKAGYSLEELAQQIVFSYQTEKLVQSDASLCLTFESCRDRIFFRLISHERNENILSDIPYLPFLDLSIVFYLLIQKEKESIRSVRISRYLMEQWGLNETDLLRIARGNTERLFPRRICSLSAMVSEMLGHGAGESRKIEGLLPEQYENGDQKEPYVITNHMGINGAAVLLYEHVLEDLGVLLEGDYYLLPSSIHEVLAVPADIGNRQELRNMVHEVNITCVDREEILSDQIYYYSVRENIIRKY